jgi:hypothetical protein
MNHLYDISMTEELVPQRNIRHETDPTEANLPAPFRDVFGKLSETPPTEDPAFWPVRVLSELNSFIVDRDYASDTLNSWGVNPRELGERFAPYQEHIRNVKRAYEILAYPYCKYEGSRVVIENELATDQHMNERDQVELNDAEATILSRLTAARKIPFNPEQRVFQYADVFHPPQNIEKALSAAEFIKWLGEQKRAREQGNR